MAEEKSVFETLNSIDVKEKVKSKNNLTYLPWSSAWAEVKKKYPDASFEVKPQIDATGNTRPWHDDGKSGWVEVAVTIAGQTITETLAIMDFKNKAIPADQITSTDANKSYKRCLVKCLALFGLGLYIYEGEDVPEETSKLMDLKAEIKALVAKKCTTDKGKEKVAALCKAAEKEANPMVNDEDISGNYNVIEDVEILENLKKQLMAVRVK